jgi:biopolymer transport protein TolQ
VLIIFSVASWCIILYKLFSFNRIHSQSVRFLEIFRRSTKFSEVQAVVSVAERQPARGNFSRGHAEVNLQIRQPAAGAANPGAPAARPLLKSLAAVDRALLRASNVEVSKLEKHITFLATTAAVTPFIGLFGTVWGIIGAFQGIAEAGSTSLGVWRPALPKRW